MAVKRALTIKNVLDTQYELFHFSQEWYDAFSHPEKSGVWFIWGNSGNGKTSFTLSLVRYLASTERVLFNSLEEGTSHTMQLGFKRVNMHEVAGNVLVVKEDAEELTERLLQRKSPRVVIIDSYQYFQLTYKQYILFKEKFPNKLIVFISHADGKLPAGRSAKSVMYDATLKIWVEGYKAISKGRYIGPTGEYVIWKEQADKYWLS